MSAPARRCPLSAAPAGASCPDRTCRADAAAPMPRGGPDRAVMLALRFVAAAAETGDGACFEAAFAEAEAVFGLRGGALVVARAAALLRSARRDGIALALLPPACRALSRDEANLLAALRARAATGLAPCLPAGLDPSVADLAAAWAEASLASFETADWTGSQLGPSQFPAVLS